MRSDCYLAKERVNGKLAAGPTFPSGLKSLGDSIHALGLKFGVSPQPPCSAAAKAVGGSASKLCCLLAHPGVPRLRHGDLRQVPRLSGLRDRRRRLHGGVVRRLTHPNRVAILLTNTRRFAGVRTT